MLLSVIWFFISGPLIAAIFPEIQNVHLWISTVLIGVVSLFILSIISSLIFIKAYNKKNTHTL